MGMKRGFVLMCVLMVVAWAARAHVADTTGYQPVYYEPAPEGKLRFFFDDGYYLADKLCPFKRVERVAVFDFAKQVFDGEFVDFDLAGRAILRGRYVNGRKDGEFTAYHPNGEVKWTVSFVQGLPNGVWSFFYPDGKPLLEVEYGPTATMIRNFWDARGRQRVTDGNGRYDFEVLADGYNPYGYVRYRRRGRVVNGLPQGAWIVEYIFDDGEKASAGHEYYEAGRFVRGYEVFSDEEFSDGPRYGLFPTVFFDRAERMVSKACSIDEYSGFTQWLEGYVEEWLAHIPPGTTPGRQVEFVIAVDEAGTAGRIEAVQSLDDEGQARLLLSALEEIAFWFPSYADGDYIEDKLTLTAEVYPDPASGRLRFFNIQIGRERGQ